MSDHPQPPRRARVLVTGSRDWADAGPVRLALNAAALLTGCAAPVIVHGACPRGADAVAATVAAEFGWPAEPHPADWGRRGAAAGPARNHAMVASTPDLVVAFPCHRRTDPGGSRGTWGCVGMAVEAGLPVIVVWGDRVWPATGPAVASLARQARRVGAATGPNGDLALLDAALPF